MTEPSTLDATRNAAVRAALTSRSLAVAVLVAATAGAAIGLILVRGSAVAAAGGAVIGMIAATVIAVVSAVRGADADALAGWATDRGATARASLLEARVTPLLRRGQEQRVERAFDVQIGGAQGCVAHLTWLSVGYRVDQRTGEQQRVENSRNPYTLAQVAVGECAVPRVYLYPKRAGGRLADALETGLTTERAVSLESAEFNAVYRLQVADEADDLVVRRLFEPDFIVWCIAQAGSGTQLEMESQVAVLAVRGHSYDPAVLDGLIERAATVARRVAETDQGGPPPASGD